MTKLSTLLMTLLGVFALSSCGEMSQEIWVNADGTGRTTTSFDLSGMLAMVESMGEMPSGVDGGDMPGQGLGKAMMGLPKRERFDTTINFGTMMIPDSIAMLLTDRAALRSLIQERRTAGEVTEATLDSIGQAMATLRSTEVHMQMDKVSEVFLVDMTSEVVNVNRPADFMAAAKLLVELMGEGGSPMPGMGGDGFGASSGGMSMPEMTLEKKSLSLRLPIAQALDGMRQQVGRQMGNPDMSDEDLLGMLEMMGMESYGLTVHVPGKIKEVTGAKYTHVDENTAFFKINSADLLRSGKDFSAEIDFTPTAGLKRVVPPRA